VPLAKRRKASTGQAERRRTNDDTDESRRDRGGKQRITFLTAVRNKTRTNPANNRRKEDRTINKTTMEESDSSSAPARWTCEACGCRTNTEAEDPTSCGVCGTRRGKLLLYYHHDGMVFLCCSCWRRWPPWSMACCDAMPSLMIRKMIRKTYLHTSDWLLVGRIFSVGRIPDLCNPADCLIGAIHHFVPLTVARPCAQLIFWPTIF
jgi:hypothetical protein